MHAWKPDAVLIDAAGNDDLELSLLVEQIRASRECRCVLWATAATGALISLANDSDVDAVVVDPVDAVQLRRTMVSTSAWGRLRTTPHHPVELPASIVGSCPEMREVWRLVLLASRSPSSIVVIGETGVGKEVVARALHRFSPRRQGPFVAVNCAALPPNLLESELFGHEPGSFTGATLRRKGRFEVADGGTIFLDEIGDLPVDLQVKLLRVLQERSFERVGSTEPVSVDVRVIAATHRNLEQEVKQGRFRADLFYRLNVLSIQVPPLRDRPGDLLSLWDQFVAEEARRESRPPPERGPDVERALLKHDWPGNVRELQNVVQHVLTVATGMMIRLADLPEPLSSPKRATEMASLVGLTMDEIERRAILETYEALGSVKSAAALLARSPRTIHYRLKRYQSEAESEPLLERHVEPRAYSLEETSRVRVLLADDDDDLRWALSSVLSSDGYDVVEVSSGDAVLERLRISVSSPARRAPFVVLIDLRMPGLNGFEVLESVRRLGWSTPVVMMSAFGDQETRRRAHELGARAFLDKPIDLPKLHGALRGATCA